MPADHSSLPESLPAPDAQALAISTDLQAIIKKRIASGDGQISLGEYMHAALYEPGLGYYTAGARKFGEQGDFVTAPELGNVFAQCLARGLARTLSHITSATVLELGAGSGQLAFDVLTELDHLGCLPQEYLILEVSPDLIARQQQLLKTMPATIYSRVQWLSEPPASAFDGAIIGNEVIDALPIERFTVDDDGNVGMDYVVCNDDDLQIRTDQASESVASSVQKLRATTEPWPLPYTGEVRTGLPDWLQTVSEKLVNGVMLFIDYGTHATELYRPERDHGTLLCHYRHRAHDQLLLWPGLQDITAWVDFSAVAHAAIDAGWQLDGYATQTHFLIDCELDDIISRRFEQADQREQIELAGQARILTMPGEMGERFKAISFSKGAGRGIFSGDHTGLEGSL